MIASPERVRELFNYDPLTGVFTRKIAKCGQPVGAIAGNQNAGGYLQVSVDGEHWYLHRLAWYYVYGECPEVIDHKNRDRSDNSLANLRSVSHAQNVMNASLRKDSRSRMKGVGWFRPHKMWRARIRKDGKEHHLGYFHNREDAAQAYQDAAARLFGSFACAG